MAINKLEKGLIIGSAVLGFGLVVGGGIYAKELEKEDRFRDVRNFTGGVLIGGALSYVLKEGIKIKVYQTKPEDF